LYYILLTHTRKRRERLTSIKFEEFHNELTNLIFVVPSIMLYSSEISPRRCNNCVFIFRNGAIAENKNAIVASCWTYFTELTNYQVLPKHLCHAISWPKVLVLALVVTCIKYTEEQQG